MSAIHLGIEKDKDGIDINVYHTPSISNSPVYTFFIRQYAELIDKGLTNAVTTWDDQYTGAVYAEVNGSIVGHIVYDVNRIQGALWIVLSSVESSYRGKGIYTILHKYFEQIALEKDKWFIASHIHHKNHARLKSADKVGMKPLYYFMAKKLKEK